MIYNKKARQELGFQTEVSLHAPSNLRESKFGGRNTRAAPLKCCIAQTHFVA